MSRTRSYIIECDGTSEASCEEGGDFLPAQIIECRTRVEAESVARGQFWTLGRKWDQCPSCWHTDNAV